MIITKVEGGFYKPVKLDIYSKVQAFAGLSIL